MRTNFLYSALCTLAFSFIVNAAVPQILSLRVDTTTFRVLDKKITFDTIARQPALRIDTLTSIRWQGMIVFSCNDSDGDPMGIFIDAEVNSTSIPADSLWGTTTSLSGNDKETYFSFRAAHRNWHGEIPARIRLTLDDSINSYVGLPRFIMQPNNASTLLGSSASFTTRVLANPTPTYQWMFNTAPIPFATLSAFSITSVDTLQAGKYFCVATNSFGSISSDTVSLSVNYTPIISLQPRPDTLNVGERAVFTTAGTGYPRVSYQWKKDGIILPGETLSVFTIPSITRSDSAVYTAVLSNLMGNTTSAAALLVVNYPPRILTQPTPAKARINQGVIFSTQAIGKPLPTYQWYKNGNLIPDATGDMFGIPYAQTSDFGNLSVIVKNLLGSDTSAQATFSLDPTQLNPDSMLFVPGGTFQMGNNNYAWPMHPVTLSSFYMSNTLVTRRSFFRVMGVDYSVFKYDSLTPAENITWYDQALYCNRRSKQEGLDTVFQYDSLELSNTSHAANLRNLQIHMSANGYRHPTEAEYEYVCRAGTSTDYYWGKSYPLKTATDTTIVDCAAIWYHNSAHNDTTNKLRPVGTRAPNPWGYYDMVGQVWQLHLDWDQSNYPSEHLYDPIGPALGTQRVARGGSWSYADSAFHLRSMARNGGYQPFDRSEIVGFRVVHR